MVILQNTFLEIKIIGSCFCLTCCFEVITIEQNSRVTITKVLVGCFKKPAPSSVVWVCSRRLVKHTLCTFLQISLCVLSSPLKGYLCATKHTLVHLEGRGWWRREICISSTSAEDTFLIGGWSLSTGAGGWPCPDTTTWRRLTICRYVSQRLGFIRFCREVPAIEYLM